MASVTAGNRIIPSQCAVVNQAITTYELFPADTFTDPEGDGITYTAGPPWQDTGTTSYIHQLLKVGGGVNWRGDTRNVYGLPGATLVSTMDGRGGQNYSVTIYATSADTSVAELSFTFRIGGSTQSMPLYTVTNYKKEFSYTVSDATIGTSVGSPTATAGTVTPDQYAIVWSSENSVGDSEGTNRSPFSINNSGLITITGGVEVKEYKLAVRATYSTYGLFDTCWVTITSTVAGLSGYIGGIPVK